MSTDHSKPGASFWLTIVAVACLAYPVSLGASCWFSSRAGVGSSVVDTVYRPILRAAEAFPNSVSKVVERYSTLGAAPGWAWMQYTGASGGWHWEDLMMRPPFLPFDTSTPYPP